MIVGDGARTAIVAGKLLQLAGQRMRPGRDVAGAEADHDVARAGDLPDQARQVAGAAERRDVAMAGARPWMECMP